MSNQTIVPTSPADLIKLKNMVVEASNCKIRIEAEKDAMKDIKERAKDELGVSSSDFNAIVEVYHKQNLVEKVEKARIVEDLYEAVFGTEGE